MVSYTRIVLDIVGQMRATLFGDEPDLELTDRHAPVRAVHVGVETGAGLQFEHVVGCVVGPDAGEGGPQVDDDRFGAPLQHDVDV